MSATYLIVFVILRIEERRRYMMSHIPVGINKLSIIGIVHHNLVLCNLESTSILKLAIRQLEDLFSSLTSEWGLTQL